MSQEAVDRSAESQWPIASLSGSSLLKNPAALGYIARTYGIWEGSSTPLQGTEEYVDAKQRLDSMADDPRELLYYGRMVVGLACEQHRIYNEARTDSLTGLLNKQGFNEELERAVSWVDATEGRGLAIAFLDLNYFKDINDKLGHDIGDEVIRKFGSLLGGNIRTPKQQSGVNNKAKQRRQSDKDAPKSWDVVGRLGGDELGVLVYAHESTGTPLDETMAKLIKRIESKLADGFTEINGWLRAYGANKGVAGIPEVSPAIGWCVFEQGDSPALMVRKADADMYRKKHENKERDMVPYAARLSRQLSEPDISALNKVVKCLQDSPGQGALVEAIKRLVRVL